MLVKTGMLRNKLKNFYLLLFLFLCPSLVFSKIPVAENIQEKIPNGKILPISFQLKQKMLKTTWHPGCPLAINLLRQVQVPYWGFDQHYHLGNLIVHHSLAKQVLNIFTQLAEHQFPMHSIIPIEYFEGNDLASMNADNTSAFNCRLLTGSLNRYSIHSYGLAIDINPLENPYITGNIIYPEKSIFYLNRDRKAPGMIIKNSWTYKIFRAKGWDWGGDYKNMLDYQHMEKM